MTHNQLEHWNHAPFLEESLGPMANVHSWKRYRFNSEMAEKGSEPEFASF